MPSIVDRAANAGIWEWAKTGRTMQARGRGTGVEISTPSAVNNEDNSGKVTTVGWRPQRLTRCRQVDNAGMGAGRQVGDLNALLPSVDGKENAGRKKRGPGGDLNAVSTAIERAWIDKDRKIG